MQYPQLESSASMASGEQREAVEAAGQMPEQEQAEVMELGGSRWTCGVVGANWPPAIQILAAQGLQRLGIVFCYVAASPCAVHEAAFEARQARTWAARSNTKMNSTQNRSRGRAAMTSLHIPYLSGRESQDRISPRRSVTWPRDFYTSSGRLKTVLT
jgi:hypothetical protein